MTARSWLRGLWLLVFVVGGVSGVRAQSTTGTLLGTVQDSGGGVLAGAKVTAAQRDTGFTRVATTDAAGAYRLTFMPLGRYDIRVELEGFKAKVVGPVTLVVDQRLRTDFVLELGRVEETVEVSGAATLLQTDQPDINQIVQEKEIQALPLSGRNGNRLPGNAGRGIIRGPGYVNFDLGLIKFVPINDDLQVQLRAEVFNLTNTPHFAMPVLRMNDPAFGKITHTRNSTNFGSTATSFASRMIQLAVKIEF